MKLETANGTITSDVSEADIRKTFADDQARGEFIILSISDTTFIQAGGEYDGPYSLEYCDGGPGNMYQCVRDVNKAEAEAAFLKYVRRDERWMSDFDWKKFDPKPWWKFW